MLSGKTVKLALLEVLQVAGLGAPVLVVMQRFAALISRVKTDAQPASDATTAYWLIVASSIAYIATVTLLVWVPVKCVVYRQRGLLNKRITWRPVTLTYILLSTLPSFAFLVASSQVQILHGKLSDTFCELPVSLVLMSLILIDILERIRPCRLTGRDEFGPDTGRRSPVLTYLDQVPSVTASVSIVEEQSWAVDGPRANGSVVSFELGPWGLNSSALSMAPQQGPLKHLCVCDTRAEHIILGFLFWLDTAELLRLTALPSIYMSNWLFPIYILGYLSTLRVVPAPQSPWVPPLGVWLQDMPFFILRVCLMATFGLVTPVLYPLKNLLVTLTFIYFNYMTRLRIFNAGQMF